MKSWSTVALPGLKPAWASDKISSVFFIILLCKIRVNIFPGWLRNAHAPGAYSNMLLEHVHFKYSPGAFDLENSFRLLIVQGHIILMVQDHKVLMVQDHNGPGP